MPASRWPPLLALLLVHPSCREAPERPAPVVPVVVALPSVTETPPLPPAAAPDPLPPTIELPASPACVIEGSWRGRPGSNRHLLLRSDGPAFAQIYRGRARLHFPSGPRPATQGLEVESDGIAVRGYVDADAADLRATRPFWLSGFVLPTVFTSLHWTEAAEAELTVTTDPPQSLELLSGPLSAKRPCADVGTDGPSFSPEQLIDGLATAKPKRFVAGHPIDIALSPGAKPVARAIPSKDEDGVDLLEVRGKDGRISWRVGTLYVVGWVAIRELRSPAAGVGYGTGSGSGGHRTRSPLPKVVCKADVRLVVEAGGERAVVGWIRAGTTIELASGPEDLRKILVHSRDISPAEGASWLALSAELEKCEPLP